MNIFRIAIVRALALAFVLPLSAALWAGCTVDSVDSTSAVLSDNDGTIYNFAGLYMNPDNTESTNGVLPLVYPNGAANRPSGELITSLRLLQYGSTLEAYDSAGMTWFGSISTIQSGTASFSLQGRTTAGQSVEVAGTLVYADRESTMDATWIEPAYYGSLYAQASVAPSATNSPDPDPEDDVSVSPSSVTLTTNDSTQIFTADGGDGSYNWTHNSSCGTLSDTTGSQITYTRISTGNDTLTVTSDGNSDSASVTCQ